MRKMITFLSFIFIWGFVEKAVAQDLHYSQHVYNPLYYNPAFTGFIDAKFRLNASYADRYRQSFGKAGMKTVFASGDINIPLGGGYSNNSNIGVGAYFYNHVAGENSIMDNVAALSLAYRIALDKNQHHTISAGVNASFVNRRYNYNSLQFGNQYDGVFYNQNINSGESETYPSKNKFDVGLGLIYSFVGTDKFRGYVGGSIFHLIPDTDNVISLGQGLRYNIHAGLELDVNELCIQPSIMMDNQGSAMEIYTGVLFKYKLINTKAQKVGLFAGPYLRMYRSPVGGFSMYTINAMVGAQFNDFQLFVTADNTISTSKNTFGGFNGFEVGLSYKFGESENGNKKIYCPVFR
jgi:type IX secretion system PorP/SprF family membrane protein